VKKKFTWTRTHELSSKMKYPPSPAFFMPNKKNPSYTSSLPLLVSEILRTTDRHIPLFKYAVELRYKDVGLCDTSAITLHSLWYQLIPHKERVFLPCLVRHTQGHLHRVYYHCQSQFQNDFSRGRLLWVLNPLLRLVEQTFYCLRYLYKFQIWKLTTQTITNDFRLPLRC